MGWQRLHSERPRCGSFIFYEQSIGASCLPYFVRIPYQSYTLASRMPGTEVVSYHLLW